MKNGKQIFFQLIRVISLLIISSFLFYATAWAESKPRWFKDHYIIKRSASLAASSNIPTVMPYSTVDNSNAYELVTTISEGGQVNIQAEKSKAQIIDFDKADNRCPILKAADPSIVACDPDYIVKLSAVPNDTYYSYLWGMPAINAPQAWDRTTGSDDVVVAVLDTGIFYNHPDLSANMWRNPGEIAGNGIDDDGNGYRDDVFGANTALGSGDPIDQEGHGTHVSGTIAGVGNDGQGIAGVCWRAKLMAVKAFQGAATDLWPILRGIDYVIQMKRDYGVNIAAINASFGHDGYASTEWQAIKDAEAEGILFIAAAGNRTCLQFDSYGRCLIMEGERNIDNYPTYPASYDNLQNLITVASLNEQGDKADHSYYGPNTVDIAAPGENVTSTYVSGGSPVYATASGTSMATPHITGAVALVKSYAPNASFQELRQAIVDGAASRSVWTNYVIGGHVLDLKGALDAINNSPPVMGDVSGDGRVTVYDASLVSRYITGLENFTSTQQQAAEVSGNGTISVYDAALIAQRSIGLISRFPSQ